MNRLLKALSKTSDGAFVINKHHQIIFWNRAAEEMLGYTDKEVIGRHCYEILGGRDEQGRTFCQRYCMVAIQSEEDDVMPNSDVQTHTRTGEERWLNVTTFVYPTDDKTTDQLIVHLFRDATEKRRNQRFVDRVLAASERLQKNDNQWTVTVSSTESQVAKLTVREQQVLKLLAQGLGTDEIASELIVSSATVRNHTQNILGKLNVHSRLEAIAFAYQHGLIEIKKS